MSIALNQYISLGRNQRIPSLWFKFYKCISVVKEKVIAFIKYWTKISDHVTN